MKWQDPPNRHRLDYKALVEALQSRPGKWALVREDAPASSAKYLEMKGCIVRTSSIGKNYRSGRADVYAKWPEKEES